MSKAYFLVPSLVFCASTFGASVFAGGVSSQEAAGRFRDSATNVYQFGLDVCGSDCEAELSGAVGNVGSTLGPLNSAISTGNPQQIRDAVANTAGALGSLCTVLRVDCPQPPTDEVEPIYKPEEPAPPLFSCEQLCGRQAGACARGAVQQQNLCNSRINEFVGCRLRTPFCDWRSAPFDPGPYSDCRNNSYFRTLLQECRCPVPPGQNERQGGCPVFFTQSLGDVGTGACEVPDGLGCARCCNAKCVPGDARLSCRAANREECDVCEWSRRTILAGNSMRSSLCDAVLFRREDRCEAMYQSCIDSCGP